MFISYLIKYNITLALLFHLTRQYFVVEVTSIISLISAVEAGMIAVGINC